MDQDPITAGGAENLDNSMSQSEPGQNIETNATITEQPMTPMTEQGTAPNVEPVAQPQVSRPVDSHHIEHDLRLPGDKAKRRAQIVIAAIIGVLVLVLGGLAIWFFAFYNNPEKVMLDGVNNIFRAPNISLNGGGSMTLREGNDDDAVQMVILNLTSSSSKLPNATDVSLLITLANEQSINLQLGTVQMTDGAIYLKVSGIMDSVRSMGLESDAEGEMEELFSTLETIDGKWWRISVRDVLEDMSGSREVADLYGSLYDCVLEAGTRDNSKTLVELYKQNKFVKVTPVKKIASGDGYTDYAAQAWHNLYEITIDKNALAEFINTIPDTAMAEEMYTCYNNAMAQYNPGADEISASDFDEISASDIDIPEELHLYAEVSQFGHKIRSIWAYADSDEWQNSFAVTLGYQEATVSAPSEYRDITELFEILPIEDAWGRVTIDDGSGDIEIDNVDCYGDDCEYVYGPDYEYDFDNYEWIFTDNEIEEI